MKIGIICDIVETIKIGKVEDLIADQEAYLTAQAVKKVFEGKGFEADIIKIDLKTIFSLKTKYDFIFNLAEGLQGIASGELKIAESLEKNKIKFTGSGSKALALCLDKAKTKQKLIENKIKTPAFQIFEKLEPLKLKFPVFVKPLHEDAGIGVDINSLADNEEKLMKKINEILRVYQQPALVEEFIDGQELSVSIIGNEGKMEVLPLAEFVFNYPDGRPKIRTYESKWVEDSADFKNLSHQIPAKLKPAVEKKIKNLALKAFKAIGCSDYGRVDFRMRGDEPFVLEVNPNPCLFPVDGTLILSAKASGYSYEGIVMKIFEAAMERYGFKNLNTKNPPVK